MDNRSHIPPIKSLSVADLSDAEGPFEEPRCFIIQSVYEDMMVPNRYAGTFVSLLHAYDYISRSVMDAGGVIQSLLANPQMGVACVRISVQRTKHTYLITPDDKDYVIPRFIPATINRRKK